MAIRTFNSAGGYSVGETPKLVISNTANVTANFGNFAGNIAALNLLTDHIFYANGAPYNFTAAAGLNGQLQFNSGNHLAGSANLTFVDTGASPAVLTVTGTANVSNLNISNNVTIGGNLIVTGVATYINTTSITVDDPLLKIGGPNSNSDSNLSSSDGKDRGLLLHNYDTVNSKPINEFFGWKTANSEFQAIYDVSSYTGEVVVANASATGNGFANIRARTFIGNLNGNVSGANVLSANYITGVLTTSNQPNITSVGILANLSVNGNITLAGGNITGANVVNANFLYGDGSNLTNLSLSSAAVNSSNYANYAGNVVNASQGNITSLGTLSGLNINGNLTSGNANLGNLVTANYYTGTLTTGNQPNITSASNLTSVGTLTSLTIQNDLDVKGNLTVDGTVSYLNTTTTSIVDPIIYQGGGANGAALTSNDNKDRGSLLHYYTTQPVDAFMGWKSANSEFIFASNVSAVSDVVTVNTLANIRANVANVNSISFSSNVSGGNLVSANYISGTLDSLSNSQPNLVTASNLTSIGTLSSLTVQGTSNLNDVGNVKITGGMSGQILTTDGTGNLAFETISTSGLNNGSSNINILSSGNIDFNVSGNSNVLVVTGNGINVNGIANASYFYGDGSNLTNITATGGTATTVNASVTNTKISGGTTNYVLAATDSLGNVTFANIANYFLIQANVPSIVPGSTLGFVANYANPSYPGGVYTLQQLGPVSITMTDQWSQGASNIGTTKNSYANYVAGTTNLANVTVTVTLANATFAIQSSDSINVGGTTLNGTQILSIYPSINGNSTATFTIPNTSLRNADEYNGLSSVTDTVTANLTNSRGSTGAGVSTVTGTTLTSTAPQPYNVNSVSGSFPANPVPYWNINQGFNWSVSVTGTTVSGNLTYTQVANVLVTGSLSSTGAGSGTSTSLDSTQSYTISTSDYTGAGNYGAGTRTTPTVPVTGTINAVTKYYPLFYKITTNSTIPTFTISDSHNSNNYALGQGATTSTTSTNYLWIAIPNYPSNSSGLASHTFKHVFGGFDIVDDPTGHTGTQTISSGGQSYNYSIYGFTGFTQASFILTTS